MRAWLWVGVLVLMAACSSSTTNEGSGGATGSGGASGAPGSGGTAGAPECVKQCINAHSTQTEAFNLTVNACHTNCCTDCSCAGGITPSSACLACLQGSDCMQSKCPSFGCADMATCLKACGAP